jgi:hypothetical protein
MIQEHPFPFWCSEHIATYTEVQAVCREKYRREGPTLIGRCKQNIERYGQMTDRREALDILLALDKDSLELSAQNPIWIDFSVAVFVVLALPSKSSISWAARYLQDIYDSTVRRIANGDAAVN